VIGVFIGIQVSNRNETRLDDQTAETYIERIREDLAQNKKEFTQRKAYFSQVRVHSLSVLDALNYSNEEQGEQFLIDAYQASQILNRVI